MGRKEIFFGGVSAMLHALLIPLFTFVFAILYKPFGIVEVLDMKSGSWSFNITILLCITLGSMAISRMVLFFIRKRMTPGGFPYATWCLGEIIFCSLFAGLYLTLMMGGERGYFEVVGATIGQLVGITIYPYTLLYLGMQLYAERNKEEVDSSSLVKFHDEYGKLKLVIASEAIIFLKSEENYVQIHYTENGKNKKFVLRSSMRALEEPITSHGLVRCHRSFFINPEHIKMIRKEPSGVVVAVLNEGAYDPIPISRKYQEEITKIL